MKREKNPGLTKKQLEIIKKRIIDEKQKLIFNGVLRSDEFNLKSEELADEVDQANESMNNAQRLRFRNREVFYVKKLEEALRRIEDDNYGHCEECDVPIKFERLLARPTADMCIDCKEESERDESGSILGRRSKSLGRPINLVNHI